MTKIIFPYIANTHCYATGFAKVKLIIPFTVKEENVLDFPIPNAFGSFFGLGLTDLERVLIPASV